MKQAKEFFLRRIAAVLAFLMVVVMLPMGAPAVATETVHQEDASELTAVAPKQNTVKPTGITTDGLEYYVYSDYVEIYQYTGSATELVIPAEIEGLPVTSINYFGFWGCENLTSISFPATITGFNGQHFASCKNVQNIYVDEENPYYCTVDGILYDKEMTMLCAYPKGRQGSFVIPDSVTSLGSHAFDGCTKLTGITIPGSVVEADWNVFSGCSGLTKVTIPGSLGVVEEYMFENCTGLTSVTIGSGITCISNSAFAGCSSLTSVNIPESVTVIGSDSGWEGAFERCTSLRSITLPSNLKSIDSNAFRNCTSLQSISIPASVTDLGDIPFYGCSSMNSIQVASGNSVYTSKDGILYDKGMTELIYCPDNKQGSITVPSGVAEIDTSAFANCAALTGIKLPDTVTGIGWSAFQNCSNLTSINIPDGITNIRSDMFNGCSSLASISIPSSVTSIGDNAFYNCSGLTSVSLPDDLREIYACAFYGCTSLKSIEIPDTVAYLGSFAFYGCSSLTSFAIPEGETGISKGTFNGCKSLKDITIHEGVTWISYYSFSGCDSLSDVYYGGSRSGWKEMYIESEKNEDLLNAKVHYAKPDVQHDTIDQLTELDYMMFADIAYEDLSNNMKGKPISELLSSQWDEEWSDKGVTYADVFGPIANWKLNKTWSYLNGFGAVEFLNEKNEAVVSFCGSRPLWPPPAWNGHSWDVLMDWVVNDFYIEVADLTGPQIDDAIHTYIEVIMENPVDVKFTGHSLGGALADIASAYSGYEAISFNAISALDVAYANYPHDMSRAFTGVDNWNITDHTNEHDILAGMYEEVVDDIVNSPIKPYRAHDNTGNAINVVANHGLASIVEIGKDGYPDLTKVTMGHHPYKPITHLLAGDLSMLHLGTSYNDSFIMQLDYMIPKVSYGGNGSDQIVTSICSDTLVGGKGNDHLNGDYLNDTYIYYKGDGHDYIRDISGNDKLYLYGFSSGDVIEVVDDDGINTIQIKCNGETIIDIYKNGREYTGYTTQKFMVYVQVNGMTTSYNITEYFNTKKYGSRVLVGCPVSVEVLDSDGNIVHTLTDGEVGSWYTDYGNFYVFEEENGEYGKVLDLVEGYTARIVGADEGTMDVTYQVPVDGELSEPVSVYNVPVTEDMTATIEGKEDGEVYLVIDTDSDGSADSEKKFYVECPFTDVPEGSYYYEPVMWAVEQGVTSGTDATHFSPGQSCNRAQVVTFLWAAAGKPDPKSTDNPFTDVPKGSFFEKPVLWAVENGITSGTDATHFSPGASCTRVQVVTFLWAAAGKPTATGANPFTDIPDGAWYAQPVRWALENSITSGISATMFGPGNICNRAQVVTFLYKAYN